MVGKVFVKRVGGYDPAKGRENRDPTLDEPKSKVRRAVGIGFDAGLIAGLRLAARIVKRDIVKPVAPNSSGHDALMLARGAIRAEIDRVRKGAKAK